MKLSIFLLISLFAGVAFSSDRTESQLKRHATECRKPDDCGDDECCMLGMERYSIPQCQKKGIPGNWCRPNAVPEDHMLYYPNEDIKVVKGAYTLFCPCNDGLTCDNMKCTTPTQNSKGKSSNGNF